MVSQRTRVNADRFDCVCAALVLPPINREVAVIARGGREFGGGDAAQSITNAKPTAGKLVDAGYDSAGIRPGASSQVEGGGLVWPAYFKRPLVHDLVFEADKVCPVAQLNRRLGRDELRGGFAGQLRANQQPNSIESRFAHLAKFADMHRVSTGSSGDAEGIRRLPGCMWVSRFSGSISGGEHGIAGAYDTGRRESNEAMLCGDSNQLAAVLNTQFAMKIPTHRRNSGRTQSQLVGGRAVVTAGGDYTEDDLFEHGQHVQQRSGRGAIVSKMVDD